jgi:hypothetical protein
MKNSRNKAFRSTFLMGITFIVVVVTLVGILLYSAIAHVNFDFFTDEEEIERKEAVKEEPKLAVDVSPQNVVYITDTLYREKKCLRKHVEQIKNLPDTSKSKPEEQIFQ